MLHTSRTTRAAGHALMSPSAASMSSATSWPRPICSRSTLRSLSRRIMLATWCTAVAAALPGLSAGAGAPPHSSL